MASRQCKRVNRWSRTWVALASIWFSPCLHAIKITIWLMCLNSMVKMVELQNVCGTRFRRHLPNPAFMSGSAAWRVGAPNRNEVTPFL